ncbi:MAG: TRAP transporter small permease [Granulosicoccus sp.]|nr:TRAP transporter small permease [Granulosicoccus sp.]
MQVFRSAIDFLGHLNTFLLFICKYLIIVIVAIIAIILIAAVVYRYGLGSAISWAEEASKYLMVWLTFLGTPIALRNFGHINIDLLYKILPPRLQQLFYLVVSVIICITMSIVFIKGMSFAEMGARQVASSFSLSMWYMYIVVPIGAALTTLVAIEQGLRALVGTFNPEHGLIIAEAEADAAT